MKIGFWGNFGTANWGNECTLQALLHNVRTQLPEAQLCCFCTTPADTTARHGVEAFPVRAPKRVSLEWLTTFRQSMRLDAFDHGGNGHDHRDVGEGPFGSAPTTCFATVHSRHGRVGHEGSFRKTLGSNRFAIHSPSASSSPR